MLGYYFKKVSLTDDTVSLRKICLLCKDRLVNWAHSPIEDTEGVKWTEWI